MSDLYFYLSSSRTTIFFSRLLSIVYILFCKLVISLSVLLLIIFYLYSAVKVLSSIAPITLLFLLLKYALSLLKYFMILVSWVSTSLFFV